MTKEPLPFALRANELLTDPSFHRFAAVTAEPNFFSIVGQSRYERWHSAFWGWLLDPRGTHNLGDFVLSRLLVLLFSDGVLPATARDVHMNEVLSRTSLENVAVRPNELDHAEVTVDPGRLDILMSGEVAYGNASRRDLNIIIETGV